MPDTPRRTWPPARDRAIDPNRPDWRAARQSGRHLVEDWALEAAQQRRLAIEYRDHLAWLVAELRTAQRAAGTEEHWCATCQKVADSVGGDS